MIGLHLSDHVIQEYVSALMRDERHEADKHLLTCEACNIEVNKYLQLVTSIQHQEKPVFDFDVTTLVLSQLPVQKKGKLKEAIYTYFEVVLACIVLFGLLYYYRKTLYLMFSGSLLINVLIITTAGLITMFLILDMYYKYHKKMVMLNNMK